MACSRAEIRQSEKMKGGDHLRDLRAYKHIIIL
jgi:hypothetical protein